MANTYKALQTVTVGAGGVASVSFTNIPQTYTDLVIKTSYRSTRNAAGDTLRIVFSNGTTYNQIVAYGNGSTVANFTGSSSSGIEGLWGSDDSNTANVFGNSEMYIPNYALSNVKRVSEASATENNAVTAFVAWGAGVSNSTSPITSITLTSNTSSTIKQYSTFTLYGVFNADVSSAPATPTIGTATAGNTTASITFTGVSNAASYTMTSTPSSITATGTTSPITVSGLSNGTAYTFKVKSNNPFGSSAESAASNSVTPVGVFNAIATTTLTSNTAVVTFSSIPQTFKHLVVRAYCKPTNVGLSNGKGDVYAYANGNDTGYRYARSTGDTRDAGIAAYAGATYLDTYNTIEWWINTYTDTNLTKQLSSISSWVSQTNVTGGSGVYQISTNNTTGNTSAVTSLSFLGLSGWSWASGSIFMLYGVGE